MYRVARIAGRVARQRHPVAVAMARRSFAVPATSTPPPEVPLNQRPEVVEFVGQQLEEAFQRSIQQSSQQDELSPVEVLVQTYERTLGLLASGAFPDTSVYRQSVETITRRKLEAVRKAGSDQAAVEDALRAIGEIGQGGLTANEGIEGALDTAIDELNTAQSVAEWKAFEPLEEAPPPRQWEYFK